MEYSHPPYLPFKSVAGALLLSVFLGPIGLLYASFWGGVTMVILGFVVVCAKYIVPIILVWLTSCIWSVAAVNHWNKKNLMNRNAVDAGCCVSNRRC